jgi:cell division GTPase FtsZ
MRRWRRTEPASTALVDVVDDVAGGVVVAGAGVAFGEPGLVQADFADVVGVVAGQGAGEQGFGGCGLAELNVTAKSGRAHALQAYGSARTPRSTARITTSSRTEIKHAMPYIHKLRCY